MDKKYINKPGKYVCVVKEPLQGWFGQKTREDGTQGAPFIRIPCVVDMPDSDQDRHESVWIGYLSEKSRERTEETLKQVFGWDGNWDDSEAMDSWVGRKVRLQCDESEWQGKIQIKARWLNPAATKKERNRAEFDKNRNMVLEQLRKEGKIPYTAKEKVVDEDGEQIPF